MKQTGKIELSKGSLIPNKRGLWYTTQEKLNEAQAGIKQMMTAEDRVNYESGWVRFVESLEEAWSSFLEEGFKNFTNFQPWAGAKKKQRKADPLLYYLIQSRHQSQHGNVRIEWEEGGIQIAPDYFGCIRDLKVYSDGSFEVEANPHGSTDNVVTLKSDSGQPKLPVIENTKYKQTYDAPVVHLGNSIVSASPHEVAAMAVAYYVKIYQAASDKFGTKKA